MALATSVLRRATDSHRHGRVRVLSGDIEVRPTNFPMREELEPTGTTRGGKSARNLPLRHSCVTGQA